MSKPTVADALAANRHAARNLLDAVDALAEPLQQAADLIADALLAGRKLLCCGNGGSACDSAHLAAEIAGRYKLERKGFPAIDLSANHALVTCLINDYRPDQLFARQVDALGAPGDVLIAFSTSGRSPNIRLALEAARSKGLKTIALLGRDGGDCRDLADVQLIVPADSTARIQEVHLLLYHTLCDVLDPVLAAASSK
jgi:D-sedoheptulose 7-phosphate isomerase